MTSLGTKLTHTIESAGRQRQKISTLLFTILTAIAMLVLLGLIIMATRLLLVQSELAHLRDSALPKLVKLAQLSQESTASIAIAPSLSLNPTRFEFETLLSRMTDKIGSQEILISELEQLIGDKEATDLLRRNSNRLVENQKNLTNVVREQIEVRRRIEKHIEFFQRVVRQLSRNSQYDDAQRRMVDLTNANVLRILSAIQDSNQARFSRNQKQTNREFDAFKENISSKLPDLFIEEDPTGKMISEFQNYFSDQKQRISDDKRLQLRNEFRIKALVEENSLIANRLLSRANTEFARASSDLTLQTQRVFNTARFTLVTMGVVMFAFILGSTLVGFFVRRRIFLRLARIRNAIGTYAETRDRSYTDSRRDEIGEISNAVMEYMDVIDQREFDLAAKTRTLEQLSNKLSKYLSPQIYESIFEGKQDVKLDSTRKKLTIFFSDIADFTETADQLESEELTQLLNQYLNEMSQIALKYGATIDKFIGDGLMIFFGDPETRGVKEDALACVKMAVGMRDRLQDLQKGWQKSGIERPLKCRMGIHTGYCTVGNFGSEDRLDYTIIGGAVNTAARLESIADSGQILISFETYAQVKEEIHCEEFGTVGVKGIAYPIKTYSVIEALDGQQNERHQMKEETHSVKIDLDLEHMTPEEQQDAVRTLQKGLDFLKNHESRDAAGSGSEQRSSAKRES